MRKSICVDECTRALVLSGRRLLRVTTVPLSARLPRQERRKDHHGADRSGVRGLWDLESGRVCWDDAEGGNRTQRLAVEFQISIAA